jgi:hypothetical protein
MNLSNILSIQFVKNENEFRKFSLCFQLIQLLIEFNSLFTFCDLFRDVLEEFVANPLNLDI